MGIDRSGTETAPVYGYQPFYIFEPRHQEIGQLYVDQERRTKDFEAQKFVKGSVGFS